MVERRSIGRPDDAEPTPASERKAQSGRILRLLIAARGAWIPLPEIMACAAQYNSRIHELRKVGFRVENKLETADDGTKHSFYRLLPGMNEPAIDQKCSQNSSPARDHAQPSPSLTSPSPAGDAESADWFTKAGRKRAVVEPETLWLWERQ